MRVVFYTLKYNYPEKEFFNLKEDVYSVMLFHWNKLSINKKSTYSYSISITIVYIYTEFLTIM